MSVTRTFGRNNSSLDSRRLALVFALHALLIADILVWFLQAFASELGGLALLFRSCCSFIFKSRSFSHSFNGNSRRIFSLFSSF